MGTVVRRVTLSRGMSHLIGTLALLLEDDRTRCHRKVRAMGFNSNLPLLRHDYEFKQWFWKGACCVDCSIHTHWAWSWSTGCYYPMFTSKGQAFGQWRESCRNTSSMNIISYTVTVKGGFCPLLLLIFLKPFSMNGSLTSKHPWRRWCLTSMMDT